MEVRDPGAIAVSFPLGKPLRVVSFRGLLAEAILVQSFLNWWLAGQGQQSSPCVLYSFLGVLFPLPVVRGDRSNSTVTWLVVGDITTSLG